MNIIAIGDVVGRQGCEFLRAHLPSVKKLKCIDLCIVNGENSAPGNGITPDSAQYLFDSGVDLITSGNHVYNKNEVYDFLDARRDIIRPANYSDYNPGRGFTVIDMGRLKVGVLNLLGNSFIGDNVNNAFLCAEKLLPELHECKVKLVDFHAEATGEKRAMGFFLDGKVTAVFGTHTHVLTADEQILPCGTAYITDIGMTGPKQSVLGINPDTIIKKMRYALPSRFEVPNIPCIMTGCIIEVDDKTGKAVGIERVCIEA
jgi:metallophosphoesterase (TIGR00282 family)